ncbi:uncharacterized protein ARMOST_12562 [Armillaria ostoyae]|uniref:Uncharacterized protein n=1 Tax=Armillaria ostoyae TaxID=47428 RepID=A0A284RKA5_ARMOS|nr:uncharacterized protein ARMOST_12562 [Armillaria ostoyae]
MTRTSASRRCTVSDIEFDVKESASCASDIFLTPIDSLTSYPSLYFSTSAAVSNLNLNPSPPPLSLWQAADQMALQRRKPQQTISLDCRLPLLMCHGATRTVLTSKQSLTLLLSV